jgi:hypothetical protein
MCVVDSWAEQQLPDDAVVVRGGTMQSRDLDRNAADHHDEFPDEWAISVWSARGVDVDGLTQRAPIRNPQICVCTVGALREIGHETAPSDEFPHADLKLRDEPSEALWEELREVFGGPTENPHRYEGP